MASIFDPKDNEDLISRIEKLTPNSHAVWGKMSVDQMLSHCVAPMDVLFGGLNLKSNFFMKIIGKLMKKSIIYGNAFQKNSPTVPEFVKKEKYDFNKVQAELIAKIQEFKKGESVIKQFEHPFFGKMTVQDWDALQMKHLDHHLSQFGA
jgi:Protein of unknown function (DUF1569)